MDARRRRRLRIQLRQKRRERAMYVSHNDPGNGRVRSLGQFAADQNGARTSALKVGEVPWACKKRKLVWIRTIKGGHSRQIRVGAPLPRAFHDVRNVRSFQVASPPPRQHWAAARR